MKLIYRALIFEFEPQSLPAYRHPHTINWRYKVPGESYEPTIRTIQPYFPKAINWRYQTSLRPPL